MNYKVNELIYAAGDDMINSIRIEVLLTELIDPEALEIATGLAAKCFPYFSVKLERHGEEYIMTDNKQPMVVSPNGKAVKLGSAESRYHLFAVAYKDNIIYLDTSHYITDGVGSFPFLKTLIYYYLHTKHPEENFDTTGIALVDREIPEEEATDSPYPSEPLKAEPIGIRKKPENIFKLCDQPQGYENKDQWISYNLNLKHEELLKYLSSFDGSPSSFFSSLVFRAITDINPENELPVVCGVQHQFRKAIKAPLSHMCHVNIAPIIYPAKLAGRSLDKLTIISRGTVVIGADTDNDVLTVNEHILNARRIKALTLQEKHEYMKKVILNGIGANTFEVSYTGKVPWNGLDKYIISVVPYLDLTLSGGLSVELFSHKDGFNANIMMRKNDPKYIDQICEILTESKISYERKFPKHFELSTIATP